MRFTGRRRHDLETLVNDYKAKTSRSRQMYEEALQVMPGGNSRTTTFFDPYPFYITRGAGPRIWDADGAERLDFNGNYTSLILGHAHASVVEAVTEQATRGMSFPGPSEHEVKLADSLTKRIPSMEAVRFVNSGTEATMNAVRAARAFTGRSKIAKFEGAYHGTHDWVLVSVSPDPDEGGITQAPEARGLLRGGARHRAQAHGGPAVERCRRLREDSREAGARHRRPHRGPAHGQRGPARAPAGIPRAAA